MWSLFNNFVLCSTTHTHTQWQERERGGKFWMTASTKVINLHWQFHTHTLLLSCSGFSWHILNCYFAMQAVLYHYTQFSHGNKQYLFVTIRAVNRLKHLMQMMSLNYSNESHISVFTEKSPQNKIMYYIFVPKKALTNRKPYH